MRETNPEQFIEQAIEEIMPILKDVFGGNLKMVALYGSAATGGFIKRVSDVNILIIVGESSVDQMLRLSKEGKKGLIDYRITPHILSEKELITSADVFPVEYQEIQATMRLLYGEMMLDSLEIGKTNIRHQVESMLRGGMNSLKQIILMTSRDEKIFKRELISWSGRQIPLFRAVLRLYNAQSEGCSSLDILKLIECLEEHVHVDCSAFRALLELRAKQDTPVDMNVLITNLTEQYMKMVEAVDAGEFTS